MDRKKLRELAEKATPGPWKTMDELHRPNGRFVAPVDKSPVAIATGYYGERALDDAAFIAAAYPGVVIELLDALDREEARVSFMENECSCMAACTDNAAKAPPHFDIDEEA